LEKLRVEGLEIMLITNARRARQVAAWASIACAALLVTACNAEARPPAVVTPSAPATQASSPAPAGSSPATPVPATTPSTAVRQTAASTFLAQGQDINGSLLFMPACNGFGCALSGDSTSFLAKMTWSTWSATEAVGTGTYKVDGCDPDCAAGPIYPVAAVVTLSNPVKVCSASGARWVWTRASFRYPDGLPKALQGSNSPKNPWVFSTVAAAAQQSCAG
jgi:hypothetical protein